MDAAACIGVRRLRRRVQERVGGALHLRQDLAPRAAAPGPGRARPARDRMVEQMDAEGFGHCSNEGECEAVCPKGISIATIARMNRDYVRATAGGGR